MARDRDAAPAAARASSALAAAPQLQALLHRAAADRPGHQPDARDQRPHARTRDGQRRADGHGARRALPAVPRALARGLVGCARGPARPRSAAAPRRAAACSRPPAISRPMPALSARLAALAPVVITQGFIASDAAGDTVLLGRGGSDTSGAYFAAKLAARRLEIWTDVPGMFSANPRSTPSSRLLRELHYDEAQEIASSGAKVLHPRCILPVRASTRSRCTSTRRRRRTLRARTSAPRRGDGAAQGQGGVRQEGHHAGVTGQPGHVARGRLPGRCVPDIQAARPLGGPGVHLGDQRHGLAGPGRQHAGCRGARRAWSPTSRASAACR